MPLPIEQYAFIGDCQSGALVGRDGSIDWLCLPRFDSDACFAALLGDRENGRWLIEPQADIRQVQRRYREETLILETEFTTDSGRVTVVDFMPLRDGAANLVRIVRGQSGSVAMRTELILRLGYGSVCPWVRKSERGIIAIAGPDAFELSTPVEVHGENFHTVGEFVVEAGESVAFTLTWFPSFEPKPEPIDPYDEVEVTQQWWRDWVQQGREWPEHGEAVRRSLITLKALTYEPTGGMVAALTTSLPETWGGKRNWDYRYCWLRDSTFTLFALLDGGYREEAKAWRDWLLRAVAGKPEEVQPIYGVLGERRLHEWEVPWLTGYHGASPVRVENEACEQLQLDVYGEVCDVLHLGREKGIAPDDNAWRIQRQLIDHLQKIWEEPDEGIWEVRGRRRHFTHSKIMAWVAVDRCIKAVKRYGLTGDVEVWKKLRTRIHEQVCAEGFDADINSFTQYYGCKKVDAALLMIPLVGFLPADDPRVAGTVRRIEQELLNDGLVHRYDVHPDLDGLQGKEGVFLICSFWLADNYALMGRENDAQELFQHLLDVRNDVGLLSEEYDPAEGRMLGNFLQAFSHIALVNTAKNLSREEGGPSEERGDGEE